jgi:hypothetical protein
MRYCKTTLGKYENQNTRFKNNFTSGIITEKFSGNDFGKKFFHKQQVLVSDSEGHLILTIFLKRKCKRINY